MATSTNCTWQSQHACQFYHNRVIMNLVAIAVWVQFIQYCFGASLAEHIFCSEDHFSRAFLSVLPRIWPYIKLFGSAFLLVNIYPVGTSWHSYASPLQCLWATVSLPLSTSVSVFGSYSRFQPFYKLSATGCHLQACLDSFWSYRIDL